jgi:hypothetical protein
MSSRNWSPVPLRHVYNTQTLNSPSDPEPKLLLLSKDITDHSSSCNYTKQELISQWLQQLRVKLIDLQWMLELRT